MDPVKTRSVELRGIIAHRAEDYLESLGQVNVGLFQVGEFTPRRGWLDRLS